MMREKHYSVALGEVINNINNIHLTVLTTSAHLPNNKYKNIKHAHTQYAKQGWIQSVNIQSSLLIVFMN